MPKCNNVAAYFMPIHTYWPERGFDATATKPYYYCQACRDEFPACTHPNFIGFVPCDWEFDTAVK